MNCQPKSASARRINDAGRLPIGSMQTRQTRFSSRPVYFQSIARLQPGSSSGPARVPSRLKIWVKQREASTNPAAFRADSLNQRPQNEALTGHSPLSAMSRSGRSTGTCEPSAKNSATCRSADAAVMSTSGNAKISLPHWNDIQHQAQPTNRTTGKCYLRIRYRYAARRFFRFSRQP